MSENVSGLDEMELSFRNVSLRKIRICTKFGLGFLRDCKKNTIALLRHTHKGVGIFPLFWTYGGKEGKNLFAGYVAYGIPNFFEVVHSMKRFGSCKNRLQNRTLTDLEAKLAKAKEEEKDILRKRIEKVKIDPVLQADFNSPVEIKLLTTTEGVNWIMLTRDLPPIRFHNGGLSFSVDFADFSKTEPFCSLAGSDADIRRNLEQEDATHTIAKEYATENDAQEDAAQTTLPSLDFSSDDDELSSGGAETDEFLATSDLEFSCVSECSSDGDFLSSPESVWLGECDDAGYEYETNVSPIQSKGLSFRSFDFNSSPSHTIGLTTLMDHTLSPLRSSLWDLAQPSFLQPFGINLSYNQKLSYSSSQDTSTKQEGGDPFFTDSFINEESPMIVDRTKRTREGSSEENQIAKRRRKN